MKIEARNERGVTVLTLKGKITLGTGDVQLNEAVTEAVAAGARNILLDLGGVTAIDSSGIGELVKSHDSVSKSGGKLKLVNLPERVMGVLQMTQVLQIFDTFENTEEALASFQ